MIVALTTASLDITLGIAWWTLKQLVYGTISLGSYLFSESSSSKKNKILGDDVNFVPHAFPIIELDIAQSLTTFNKPNDDGNSIDNEEFVEISKTDCILTTRDKYFKIPISDIIKRKSKLPLWIIPFLNTYILANYSITKTSNNSFTVKHHDTPIFSPFTLSQHLLIPQLIDEHMYVYLRHNDVEIAIKTLTDAC